MTRKRELTSGELLKLNRVSGELHELIYEMSPHQLELLCSQAVKILNKEPINK